MVKYREYDQYSHPLGEVLTHISNELAEANRLMRKNIEWSHPELSGKMLQEVKEDRA